MLIAIDPIGAKFGDFAVRALAVAGGFMLGWVLVSFLLYFLGKYSPQKTKNSNTRIRRGLRFVGGIIGALIVAGILFSHGSGWNFFGGSSGDEGSGTPINTAITTNATTKTPPNPAPPTSAPTTRMLVTVLGGEDVKDERFYQLDQDATPKTYAEFIVACRAKKDNQPDKKLSIQVRFSSRNALPTDHPAVQRIVRWARETGIEISFPADSP